MITPILHTLSARQQADDDLRTSNMLICNGKGKPLEPRRFAKEFDKIRDEIGMKDATRHALRHAITFPAYR